MCFHQGLQKGLPVTLWARGQMERATSGVDRLVVSHWDCPMLLPASKTHGVTTGKGVIIQPPSFKDPTRTDKT